MALFLKKPPHHINWQRGDLDSTYAVETVFYEIGPIIFPSGLSIPPNGNSR